MLYTSGSTGRPKGVMLSHANLWLGAISVAHYLGLKPDDRTLCVLPLAFDYGQNQLLAAWAAGSCAIAFDYLLPRDVVRAVGRHDVTILAGVPPLWHQLVEQKWDGEGDSLRTLTNSGGHLPEPLVRRLRGAVPGGAAAPDVRPDRGVSVGQPRSRVWSMRIPTASAPRSPLPSFGSRGPMAATAAPGEEGELVHSGPLVAQGYWNDPERTAGAVPAMARSGRATRW